MLSTLVVACLVVAAPSGAEVLCSSASDCGTAEGICGEAGKSYAVADKVPVCLGFQASNDPAAALDGSKAVYHIKVDDYSSISADTLGPIMGSLDPAQQQPYSHMWVGMGGRRTIGQQEGEVDSDGHCITLDALELGSGANSSSGKKCYGWREHNKPTALENTLLTTSLTVLIHLESGKVNRIVWDNGCHVCSGKEGGIQCHPDATEIACYGADSCEDCYVNFANVPNISSSEIAGPKVYIAWVGTDSRNQPLLSANSIMSRFQKYSIDGYYDKISDEVSGVIASAHM